MGPAVTSAWCRQILAEAVRRSVGTPSAGFHIRDPPSLLVYRITEEGGRIVLQRGRLSRHLARAKQLQPLCGRSLAETVGDESAKLLPMLHAARAAGETMIAEDVVVDDLAEASNGLCGLSDYADPAVSGLIPGIGRTDAHLQWIEPAAPNTSPSNRRTMWDRCIIVASSCGFSR